MRRRRLAFSHQEVEEDVEQLGFQYGNDTIRGFECREKQQRPGYNRHRRRTRRLSAVPSTSTIAHWYCSVITWLSLIFSMIAMTLLGISSLSHVLLSVAGGVDVAHDLSTSPSPMNKCMVYKKVVDYAMDDVYQSRGSKPFLSSDANIHESRRQFTVTPPPPLEEEYYYVIEEEDEETEEKDSQPTNVTFHNDDGHVYTSADFTDDYAATEEQYILDYFAFDDDSTRSNKNCRRTSWHRHRWSTCNNFHEIDLRAGVTPNIVEGSNNVNEHRSPSDTVTEDTEQNDDGYYYYYSTPTSRIAADAYFVGRGYYRDAWSIYNDQIVLKVLRFEREYHYENYEMVRMDALIMTLMKQSHRILDMYGHCGISIMVQAMYGPTIDSLILHSDEHEGHSELTPTQKLAMALQMSEAISDLHGYHNGPIVHNDIQYTQFLLDDKNNVYLSDFNRAEPLLWDTTLETYCKYYNGMALGNVRSPEEYAMLALDESIDVYSFGMILYTLLSGKDAYEGYDDTAISESSINRTVPAVDDRIVANSFAEAAINAVMKKCFEYYPEERISIFEVSSLLRDVMALNERL